MTSPTGLTPSMRDWEQGRCPADDGTSLRWFRSGGNGPPLLLVHGFTDSALYFSRAAERLANDWEIVAYDARGHGASGRAGDRFDDAIRVSDLRSVVNALGLDRPAMVGHSMGASTIALAVAANPGIARAVVLEDPAWWETPIPATDEEAAQQEATRQAGNTTWRDWVAWMQQAPREEALAARRSESPLWSEDDVALSLDARMDVQLGLFEHFPSLRAPWRTVVPLIDCPTLLVLGDSAAGGIITPELAAEAGVLNPLISSAHIIGAGHAIRYDRFEPFMEAVTAFLARHRH